MMNLLFAGITLVTVPFTGQYSEDFENHVRTKQLDCIPDRILGGAASLCVDGVGDGDGNCTITTSFTPLNCCTTTAQGGAQFMWTQTSHFDSSYVEIVFDEPAVRFGGYFTSSWTFSRGIYATFYAEDDTIIDSLPITVPTICGWAWNGFNFGPDMPCKRIRFQNDAWFGVLIDGLQMDRAPLQPGIDTCFPGKGTIIACPCGNNGELGRGCGNSANAQGAHLTSTGVASLAADTLVFSVIGEPLNSNSILLQIMPQARSVVYGQGVRCGGTRFVRLYSKVATNGSITMPGVGNLSISTTSAAKGKTLIPGTQQLYAIAYYDTSVFAGCPATSLQNITQSQLITWQ